MRTVRLVFCFLWFCFFGRTADVVAESHHTLLPANLVCSNPKLSPVMPLPSPTDLRTFSEHVIHPLPAPNEGNTVQNPRLTEKNHTVDENSKHIDKVFYVKKTEKKAETKEYFSRQKTRPRLNREAQKKGHFRNGRSVKFGIRHFFPKYRQLLVTIMEGILHRQWDEGLNKPLMYIGIGFLILIIGPFLPLEILKISALLTGLILLGFGIYFLVLFLKDQ